MAKENVTKSAHYDELMEAIKKFQDAQEETKYKMQVKRIVMTIKSGEENPCSEKICRPGYHPEIFIDPNNGDVSCRCVKN